MLNGYIDTLPCHEVQYQRVIQKGITYKMKEKLKHFSLLTASTLIMAVGTYFFKFTNNFTFGGITGLAVLVADKTSISASDFSFIVNMLLLVLGFVVLGKKFAAKEILLLPEAVPHNLHEKRRARSSNRFFPESDNVSWR